MNIKKGTVSHSNPSPGLIIMPDYTRRRHALLPNFVPRRKTAQPIKCMDLDRVVVARRRNLSCRIERCMTDTEARLVLAYQRGELGAPFAAQFS